MFSQLGHLPMDFLLIVAAVILASLGFIAGRLKAETFAFAGEERTHSRPNSHGYYVLMWALVPAVTILLAYVAFAEPLSKAWLRRELPAGFSVLSRGELASYLDAVARAAHIKGLVTGEHVFDTVTTRYDEILGTVNRKSVV